MRGVFGVALAALLICLTGSAGRAADAAQPDPHVIITSDRDGDTDVYGISADGRRVAALTRNRTNDSDVLISPTGAWIALTRGYEFGRLVSADGRRERRLPGVPAAFSPDGSWLALTTGDPVLENWGVATVRTNGRGLRRFGPGSADAISPDGRLLSFWDDFAFGVVDLSTGKRSIVLPRDESADGQTLVWSPHWSKLAFVREVEGPDGLVDELVVLDRTRPGSAPTVLVRGDNARSNVLWLDEDRLALEFVGSIRVVGADGKRERLTGTDARDAQLSPERDVLAYKEYVDAEYRFVSALFLAPADGSQATKVALPGEPQRFAWSPSGLWVAVVIGTGPRSNLAIVDASRALVVRTIDLPWAADEVLWSPDDARILVRAFNDRELAIATANGGPVARIATPGRSAVIGWMKGPLPRAAPKAARPPPVELARPAQLRSRGQIVEIASDRTWAAALVDTSGLDCAHVVAWNPPRRSIVRFEPAMKCDEGNHFFRLSLRGTRLTWRAIYCGNYCYLYDYSADVRRPGKQGSGNEREVDPDTVQVGHLGPPAEIRATVTMSIQHGTIVLRRRSDGALHRLRPPGGAVDAELERVGLYYGYNLKQAKFPGRVAFIPFRALFSR